MRRYALTAVALTWTPVLLLLVAGAIRPEAAAVWVALTLVVMAVLAGR